ncbi:MAG: hypothetical protein ACJ74G_08500 [Blastocatellia bacterium]
MELTTKYLIIVDKNASQAFYNFCEGIDSFKHLLGKDPNVAIEQDSIIFRQSLGFVYDVKTGQVEGKEQRFFLLKVVFNGEEINLEGYTGLLRAIRSIIRGSGGQLETLRDDVSFYYSSKSYPLIHKIENQMRKLITYFMLTNVGKEWVAETLPGSVKEAIDKGKRKEKEYVDILHRTDFIHLGDFLFKPYQTRNVSELFDKLDKAQNPHELDLNDLREFKPRSNWERYFSKVVRCSNEFLNKKWTELYDLRCIVAHSAPINKTDYEKVESLVQELGEYLQNAIDNLDRVYVPKEEREQVAEVVVSNISAGYGSFISLWKDFESNLRKVALEYGLSLEPRKYLIPTDVIRKLHEGGVIDKRLRDEAYELTQFRNQLVHDSSLSVTQQEIDNYIARLKALTRALTGTWRDEVLNALQALGGKATVPELYKFIESNTLRQLPNTWKSTVRKTLQIYSSDTKAYKQGEDLFEHLGKAYWGIRTSPKKLKQLNLE